MTTDPAETSPSGRAERKEPPTPPRMATAPGYVVRRLYQAYQAAWLTHVDPVATGPQVAVLMAVGASPGVEQGILGASIALDRSTMASIVNRLELRGLLQRSRPDMDRRKRLLYLTDSGRVTMEALVDRAQELDALLMDGYGSHGSELIVDLLTRLALHWESVANADRASRA